MIEDPTLNVIVGVVVILVLERMGSLVIGVIRTVKNGNGGRICNPDPKIVATLDRACAAIAHLSEDTSETRRMTGAIFGKTDRILDRLDHERTICPLRGKEGGT